MVKIRLMLRRVSQSIVVADSARARNTKVIDELGIVCVERNARHVNIDIMALRS